MNIKNLIWYEKHRPKKIDDLILDEHVEKHLKKYTKAKEIPHLLLVGQQGSGKTTIADILITYCASSYLVLNASSEDRGIDTIKKKVTQFAKNLRKDKDKINIVFFDEADGLTSDAQFALKNTIEKFHKNCRFIFTANEENRIIAPLKSRCIRFNFQTIPIDQCISICKKILKKEDINFDKKDLKTVIKKFYPDIRSIINELQSCSISGKLNLKHLGNVEIDLVKLESFLDKGKIKSIRNLWAGTFNFDWLYKFLFDKYIPNLKKNGAECALHVAEYMYRDRLNIDKEINATACLVDILLELERNIEF